jgi:hypothetical protein
LKATAPDSAIATVRSVVATGLWTNGAEIFMRHPVVRGFRARADAVRPEKRLASLSKNR